MRTKVVEADLIVHRSVARTREFARRMLALTSVAILIVAILPTSALAADPDPAAGYRATSVVNGPDGQPRGDGRIAVGDDLHLAFRAVDGTPVSACQITVLALGGWIMVTPGDVVSGECRLTMRLPEFSAPGRRSFDNSDLPMLDLCVLVGSIAFADHEDRAMVAADRLGPGGRDCTIYYGVDPLASLDFPVEPGGTPRPFVSNPLMVSWNIADWGTGMVRPTFGSTWHYEAPAGIDQCRTSLNGSWTTVIVPRAAPGCAPWDVRLPGVLPATLPWGLGAAKWDFELLTTYMVEDPGPASFTISFMSIPMAPSDGVFESSLAAIFPLDLATTRFVTAGERWRPAFKVSGGTPSACIMTYFTVPPTFPVDEVSSEEFHATPDDDGVCTFDVAPIAPREHHQYAVIATLTDDPNPNMKYGGSIEGIPPPEQPVIEPPVPESDGDTGIGVEPGDGQGLALELEVRSDPLDARAAADASASTATVLCADRAISTDINNGGAIPHLDASCGLAPGRYVATAWMVDAAGIETSSERAFTVVASRPHVTTRNPASGATGVARDVRPTVTFDLPVTGVAASTYRLRDLAKGTYVPATVTYNATTHKATLRPDSRLRAGMTYRLSLSSGIRSAYDLALAPTSWTFRVSTDVTRPTIIGRVPAKGATGVSRTANIAVRFSSAVRGVSATSLQLKDLSSGLYVPAVVTYDSSKHRATLNPGVKLDGRHRYQVVVRSSIMDRAGNAFKKTTWSFTTKR